MADRGFTLLNVIDHSGVAERAGDCNFNGVTPETEETPDD
jgi:hypothetical protein